MDKMALVNPAYMEAADAKPGRWKVHVKKWCAAAACLCLVLGLAVPAAAAIPDSYDMLYALSPAAAQFFKPVQMSCEDKGIRMEAVAAYIHEDTAEIYISMQDSEGKRFGETLDLFDSYEIRTPFDYVGHCELSAFDQNTQTAIFLVTIEQADRNNIMGKKMTFSVGKFLSNIKEYQGTMKEINLRNMKLTTLTQTVQPRGVGVSDSAEYERFTEAENVTVLNPSGSIHSPLQGVTVTGVGYVEGELHIQVYYEDIRNTGNHGSVSLINRETGKAQNSAVTVSFWDDAKKGSYNEYIFTGLPADALGKYDLHGDFEVSSGSVEGNWSITFPLEDTAVGPEP